MSFHVRRYIPNKSNNIQTTTNSATNMFVILKWCLIYKTLFVDYWRHWQKNVSNNIQTTTNAATNTLAILKIVSDWQNIIYRLLKHQQKIVFYVKDRGQNKCQVI